MVHVLALAALLTGVFALANGDVIAGSLFGLPTVAWLVLAISVPIAHQTYVWLMWRLELYHVVISDRSGMERGFRLFSLGFSNLFASRLGLIILLAVSNHGTLEFPRGLGIVIAVVLSLASLHVYDSVLRYLGAARSYGVDHFDPTYRDIPFAREDVFRFTGNAIYTFGFGLLWVPAFIHLSQAALLAALFSQLYIWGHYYCTELPDIAYIYGDGERQAGEARAG